MTIGIDVGGTFTDLAALSDDGSVLTSKVLSVPADRAKGVLDALATADVLPGQVVSIAHGTTVVTNLLLERRGARVVACATQGFTDLLELRRQERAALYDLSRHHAPSLVPCDRVVAVRERMAPDGVVLALEEQTVSEVVAAVLALDPDTIAITLLHAYAMPAHEQCLAGAFRAEIERRGLTTDVVASHDVLPEIREYERMATTVAEAYARPAVRRYLSGLTGRLAEHGYPAPRVMTSAGGTLTAQEAANHAAALALSGPSGGVAGAAAVARALGISEALTIDIGGTSADVGLIQGGEPLVSRGSAVAGIPIALPRVLVEAVAAGGGSIAWLDDGGALRVGPESAGAMPGPAAYARGGERPTVTDAHVVLGTISADAWSGGVRISREHAHRAMMTIAVPLGVSVARAAEAVIGTADATMARALRRVSVERGVDPRGIPLIAFGGGGPLHACGLAERLGLRRVIVPPHAGVLSAVGLALAPERRESLTSCMITADAWSDDAMRTALEGARRTLTARGSTPDPSSAATPDLEVRWAIRARYVGQGYELDVPLTITDSVADVARRFVEHHIVQTGFELDRVVEFISLRTTVGGKPRSIRWRRQAEPERVRGPRVVALADATMLVARGWTAQPLEIGGWLLEVDS